MANMVSSDFNRARTFIRVVGSRLGKRKNLNYLSIISVYTESLKSFISVNIII